MADPGYAASASTSRGTSTVHEKVVEADVSHDGQIKTLPGMITNLQRSLDGVDADRDRILNVLEI